MDARHGLFVAAVRNHSLCCRAAHLTSVPRGIDERPVRGATGMVADGALGTARTKSGDDCRSGGRQSRMVVLMAQSHAKRDKSSIAPIGVKRRGLLPSASAL